MRIVEGKETAFTVNVTAYLNETSKEQEFRLLPDDVVLSPSECFNIFHALNDHSFWRYARAANCGAFSSKTFIASVKQRALAAAD